MPCLTRLTPFAVTGVMLMLTACATPPEPASSSSGDWWTFNSGTRTCLRAGVSPAGARSEEQARGGACRRLSSFDPDAYVLMCTRPRGEKLRVLVAGFGRDETACRAAGRDVIRHLKKLRRAEPN